MHIYDVPVCPIDPYHEMDKGHMLDTGKEIYWCQDCWRADMKIGADPNCPTCHGDGCVEQSCARGEVECRCRDLAALQKENEELKDEIDTIEMNTLPPENDKGCYALVNRTELEQVFRRLKGAP